MDNKCKTWKKPRMMNVNVSLAKINLMKILKNEIEMTNRK